MNNDDITMEEQVQERAAALSQAAKEAQAPAVASALDKGFVLDRLRRNRVGDADLYCTLFRGKYVYVEEWGRWLHWTGNHWDVDMRDKRALADVERVCAAYQNAFAESGDDEDSPLHKTMRSRLDKLRSAAGVAPLNKRLAPLHDVKEAIEAALKRSGNLDIAGLSAGLEGGGGLGAALGSIWGPVGAGIGAVLGGASGLIMRQPGAKANTAFALDNLRNTSRKVADNPAAQLANKVFSGAVSRPVRASAYAGQRTEENLQQMLNSMGISTSLDK